MGREAPPAGAGGGAPPAHDGEAARPSPAQGLIWVILALVIAVVLVAGAWSFLRRLVHPPLPVLGEVPGFTLNGIDGRPVGLEDLKGAPWIADFIFTRCTGICPLLSVRMVALQEALGADSPVRLVSISVDPQHDTPEVLAAYARRNGADTGRWLFLTGGWEETRSLIGDGFHLGVARADPGEVDEGELVTHSDRLVLVDADGRIRGYYHGSEEDSTKRILADLGRLGG